MLDIHDKKNSIYDLCQGIEKREREEFNEECKRVLKNATAISLFDILGEENLPCIAVYPRFSSNPCDYYVHSIEKTKNDEFVLVGEIKDGWDDIEIRLEDVMTGHLSWVTDELRLIINT